MTRPPLNVLSKALQVIMTMLGAPKSMPAAEVKSFRLIVTVLLYLLRGTKILQLPPPC